MEVTEIEAYGKAKYKVFLNDEFAFVLYRGELKKYQIKEGLQVEQDIYDDILENVLCKRAKARSLHLLLKMERTETQLVSKLRENLYPEHVIAIAVEYVKSYGYVNDEHYAMCYAQQRGTSKSKRQIAMELMKKGIHKEIINEALIHIETDEEEIIKELIRKKTRGKASLSELDGKEKSKLFRYLAGKGFQSDNITRVFVALDIT